MSDESLKISVDHLAIGLTRSAMFMGVNVRNFFGNIVLCTLICIDAHTFLGVPLFVIFHFVILKASIKESNFLSIYVRSFFKTTPILNHRFWGKTNSYEPW